MQYLDRQDTKGHKFRIPVADVRKSKDERAVVEKMVKASNGNTSKYIPAKYGYGVFGPKKY